MAAALAVPGTEIVAVDAMQVYRGMDIGTAKPTADDRAVVRHHCLDLVDPSEEFTVADYQRAYAAAISTINGRPLLVAGTGLYLSAVVDRLEVPGRWPEIRRELDDERDLGALWARLVALDPVAASRIDAGNRRRIVRALEVTLGAGRPFSSFGPGLQAYPATDVVMIGLRWPRQALAERIAQRVQGWWPMACRTRCDGWQTPVRCPRRPARHSATRSSSTSPTWTPPWRPSPAAPASSPSARSGGSVETGAYAGSTSNTSRSPRRRRR